MNVARVRTLIGKELREFRSSPAVVLPVVILVVICVALPFFVVFVIPRITGQSLGSDPTLARLIGGAASSLPGMSTLPAEAAAQAYLFQQFLSLFLVAPIVGAVSLAAYAVVGEKQGRTLEPLLTTPLTTAELLLAKVLAAILPALTIEAIGLVAYLALAAAAAAPGVAGTLLGGRSLVLILLFGPIASLVALQVTIAISSRVTDPRSAQQVAALLVLPLVTMLVGQIAGAFVVTSGLLLAVSAALGAAWIALVLLSVALFDRETVLTRWK